MSCVCQIVIELPHFTSFSSSIAVLGEPVELVVLWLLQQEVKLTGSRHQMQ